MNFETHLSEKNTFRFNELTSLVGVKPYVLRFWESEFDQINPTVDDQGQKVYSSNDLEKIKKIKGLLFSEKLSIPQAKNQLDQEFELAQKEKEDISSQMEVIAEQQRVQSSNVVSSKTSSLELMKKALEKDLNAKQETKSEPVNARVFQDKDIVSLVQAKKKLTSVLSKVNELAETRGWN